MFAIYDFRFLITTKSPGHEGCSFEFSVFSWIFGHGYLRHKFFYYHKVTRVQRDCRFFYHEGSKAPSYLRFVICDLWFFVITKIRRARRLCLKKKDINAGINEGLGLNWGGFLVLLTTDTYGINFHRFLSRYIVANISYLVVCGLRHAFDSRTRDSWLWSGTK